MATAKKTASGKWRVLVYIGKGKDGKKKYKSFTDADKRKCERAASAYVDEHRRANDPQSFGSALSSYLVLRKAVLSPSTYRGYSSAERYFRKNFRGFCEHSIYDLTPDYMQTIVSEMVEDGQSPKSVANKIGLVSSVLKAKDVQMPLVRLPEKEKPDYHVPDTKDVERIIECAEGKDIEIPILLAAYGGMRRSEICALTLDDIAGDTICITKAIVLNDDLDPVKKSTKTYESKRDVPMPHEIIEKILEKGYVTDAESPERISERFSHIAKKAGCPGTRFHDLRHFHASYLHAKGVPDQYIMARCGWKTDNVMKKIYMHTLQSEEKEMNQKILSEFSKMLKGQRKRQQKK